MKTIVQIGLAILAIMFVMKMMKGNRSCEGFTKHKRSKVACNCNITNKKENFANQEQAAVAATELPENEASADESKVVLPEGEQKVKACLKELNLSVDTETPMDKDVVSAISNKCIESKGDLNKTCIDELRDKMTACITKNDKVKLKLETFNNLSLKAIEHFEKFGNIEGFA